MEENIYLLGYIKNILIVLFETIKEYGPGGIIGGMLGGILIQLKTKGEKMKTRVINIIIAAFIGWVIGRLTTYYLEIPIDIAMVFSSLGGFYSNEISQELKEILSDFSERIKSVKFKKNDNTP